MTFVHSCWTYNVQLRLKKPSPLAKSQAYERQECCLAAQLAPCFWTHSPSRDVECLKRPCSFSTTSKRLLTYAQKSTMGIDPLYFTPFTKSLRNLRIFYLFAFEFIDSEITTCFWHIKWQVTYKGWGRAERRLQYCVYRLSPLLSLLSFFSRFLFISSSTRKPFHSSVIAHAHLIYKTTEHLRATFLPNLISPYFASKLGEQIISLDMKT